MQVIEHIDLQYRPRRAFRPGYNAEKTKEQNDGRDNAHHATFSVNPVSKHNFKRYRLCAFR